MDKKIDHLPQEKKELILNAAYHCFSKNGFEKTSIADIANAADISKASVFHYFGTKKECYLYLYRFALDQFTTSVKNALQTSTSDFFERMFDSQRVKMQLLAQYRTIFDFLSSAVAEESPSIRFELDQLTREYQTVGFHTFLDGIDWTKFVEGISPDKIVNIINWVSKGYINEAYALNKSTDTMMKEIDEYMTILKQVLYKEEYQ